MRALTVRLHITIWQAVFRQKQPPDITVHTLQPSSTMRVALLGASLLLVAVVTAQTPEEYKRVDLDLFVMSKCP